MEQKEIISLAWGVTAMWVTCQYEMDLDGMYETAIVHEHCGEKFKITLTSNHAGDVEVMLSSEDGFNKLMAVNLAYVTIDAAISMLVSCLESIIN